MAGRSSPGFEDPPNKERFPSSPLARHIPLSALNGPLSISQRLSERCIKYVNKIGRFVLIPAAAMLAVALPTSAMATSTARPTTSSAASLGAWKAAHDTDPHTPIINGAHHQGLPVGKQGVSASLGIATSSLASLGIPATKLIAQNQQGQQTGYWCGPAAESEAIGILGASYSQSSEASYLKTTTNGTAWSGVNANVPTSFQTGYPMRDVLNYEYYVYTNGGNAAYSVVAVPSTPSQADTNNYVSNMSGDIYYDWPFWEMPGRLPGIRSTI